MALRLTTWNVNGIRNPFNYQPWRDTRSFQGMFDILETDLVAFQETKIQRKDLRDDMVLVEGWDCYFSLPKVKKGYSGVVIYTRNSTCAPIRAEEGVTGILCPPKSTTSFRDLPEDQQIGGYPTARQLAASELDAATLDSEGRCVILEFPAFVLLGVYSPATRDVSRDDFRLGFLNALEFRIRNLIAMGKRVVLMGDLNIARSQMDSAHCREQIRKNNVTEDEYISSPSRRMFNHLVQGGKIVGERDEGREEPVLLDLCREFHPDRMGMYTCWEQRINARPGNYGARIDYVLCSLDMKDWFESANIQEGLMGSDHCPVYATCKEKVLLEGEEVHIRDIMNPPGTFKNGERKQEYSAKNILAISGRMIPEFNRRRNIADMLFRKPSSTDNSLRDTQPSLSREPSAAKAEESEANTPTPVNNNISETKTESPTPDDSAVKSATTPGEAPKRSLQRSSSQSQPPAKRPKSTTTSTPSTGQRTLKGFFASSRQQSEDDSESSSRKSKSDMPAPPLPPPQQTPETVETPQQTTSVSLTTTSSSPSRQNSPPVHDPIANKESWSKLFTKKTTPKCEGHNEPCITYTTKKPGVNCGRSFWICSRPLGPSGNKEVGTQWRCGTFIWSSDWNG